MNDDFTRFPDTISSVTNDSKLYWYTCLTNEMELARQSEGIESSKEPPPPPSRSLLSSSKPIISSPFIP